MTDGCDFGDRVRDRTGVAGDPDAGRGRIRRGGDRAELGEQRVGAGEIEAIGSGANEDHGEPAVLGHE